MFIIFGSPRSGTTLLATTLNLNDQIIVPDETDFIVPTTYILNRVKDPEAGKILIGEFIPSTARFDSSIGKYLSKKDVLMAVRGADYDISSIISGIYNKISEKLGKTIAGDKSPNDLPHVAMFYRNGLFNGKIKIIHIIRDIRDVISSLKKVEWSAPEVESNFPQTWNNSNIKLFDLFNRKKEYLLVKYEDMVINPKDFFEQICVFLGVPYQEKMLDHTKRGLDLRAQKHHRNLAQPFLSNKAGAWEKTMPPKLIKQCEKYASDALILFDYKITSNVSSLSKSPKIKLADMKIKIRNMNEKIFTLNNRIDELSAWGRKQDKEINIKDRRIVELQDEVEKLGNWGHTLNKDIADKDERLIQLQKELDDKSGAANNLHKELSAAYEHNISLQKEINKINGKRTN